MYNSFWRRLVKGAWTHFLPSLLLLVAMTGSPALLHAQTPPLGAREVAVVANYSFPGSVELARLYMKGRGIPDGQLLITGMPKGEAVSRVDYERYIAAPLKDFLLDKKLDRVRCVVLIYGVPVKVLEPVQSGEEKKTELLIREERERLITELIGLVKEAQALARDPAATVATPTLPAFDPQSRVSDQIRGLREFLLKAFVDDAARLQASSAPKPDKSRLVAAWLQLWSKAFGFVSPHKLGLSKVPEIYITEERQAAYANRTAELLARPISGEAARELFTLAHNSRGVSGALDLCDTLLPRVRPDWTHRAAVDSELCTLFWPPFPLGGSVPNPLSLHSPYEHIPRTLMVCRLDGPDEATVRRMIQSSLEVEKRGLKGTVYLDARGIEGSGGYALVDNDLRKLSTLVEEFTKLKGVLDNRPELFARGQCPEAALYCGWYSLGKYVDAFDFAPGAVGFHLASFEAMNLRAPESTAWCPQLLKHGVVATLGPVEEPHLSAFPLPAEFFGLLLCGRYPLADCYFKTTPRLSWMMTLIGDPLYNPFAARPALEEKVLSDLLFADANPDAEQ